MSFLFRLCSPDGDDLGDYRSAVPDWLPGDQLYYRGWPKWRVRSVIPGGELPADHYAGILEVEEI
jgi:hypothetical protein